jgi:hypothetical protein
MERSTCGAPNSAEKLAVHERKINAGPLDYHKKEKGEALNLRASPRQNALASLEKKLVQAKWFRTGI